MRYFILAILIILIFGCTGQTIISPHQENLTKKSTENNEKDARITLLKNEIADLQSKINNLSEEIKLLKEENDNLTTTINQTENVLDKSINELASSKKKINYMQDLMYADQIYLESTKPELEGAPNAKWKEYFVKLRNATDAVGDAELSRRELIFEDCWTDRYSGCWNNDGTMNTEKGLPKSQAFVDRYIELMGICTKGEC